jgi:hypothetical protein
MPEPIQTVSERAVCGPKMNYFVRPDCGRDGRNGPVLGPFPDYLELTYKLLRSGPNGDDVASLGDDGDWHFETEWPNATRGERGVIPVHDSSTEHGLGDKPWHAYGWSDIAMWAEPTKS